MWCCMSLTTIHNQTSGIKHKEREIGSRKNTIFTQQKYLYIQGKWKMKTDFCVMTGEQESVSKTMANNFYSFRWDSWIGRTIPCKLRCCYDERMAEIVKGSIDFYTKLFYINYKILQTCLHLSFLEVRIFFYSSS